jgi:drug/metabolite transporter (DMT)-like permease
MMGYCASSMTGVTAGTTTPIPTTGRGGASHVLAGATAMVFVGGSAAVSGVLTDAPLATAQALRYAVASLLLVLAAALARRPLRRPRGREWGWLAGVATCGLLVFNVALVRGAIHAEPAVFGVAVASVPLVLALAGPLLEGRRPRPAVVGAAVVVTLGAALVQGFGRSDAVGLAWALVVLVCEVGFTLLAVPVLGRHGPWGVSVHTTWMAAVGFTIAGLLGIGGNGEGPGALAHLTRADLLAVGYLAVAVTAVAFVLWYTSVRSLGAARAGLLTGVAPVAAAACGVALGGPVPAPPVWVGTFVVAAALAVGLRGSSAAPRAVERLVDEFVTAPAREGTR